MGAPNDDDIQVANPVIVPTQPNPAPVSEPIKLTPAPETATPTTN